MISKQKSLAKSMLERRELFITHPWEIGRYDSPMPKVPMSITSPLGYFMVEEYEFCEAFCLYTRQQNDLEGQMSRLIMIIEMIHAWPNRQDDSRGINVTKIYSYCSQIKVCEKRTDSWCRIRNLEVLNLGMERHRNGWTPGEVSMQNICWIFRM